MKDHSVSTRKSERGQSLIEFAFSLVLLLVLVAGVFDGSRALFTYLSMRDAAQEGALYGSVDPTNTAEIIDRVCGGSNLVTEMCDAEDGSMDDDWNDADLDDEPGLDVIVEYPPSGGRCMSTSGTANGVRVTVRHYEFPLTMPFIGILVGGNSIEITASILDTIITPTCP
jgi:hypothetical protein